jgi:hypothetical protein
MIIIKINYASTLPNVSITYDQTNVYAKVVYGTGGSSVSTNWGDIGGTLSDQTDLQSALDAKVPYSGATADVDLGEYELKAGQIEFDQTPTGAVNAGVLRWNDSDGTLDLRLKGNNVTLQIGQEQVARVVNKTGGTLQESAYQAVRVRRTSEGGSQGQRLAVVLAQANNDANSVDTLGIVTETISDNQEGFITTSGLVNNINTTGSLQGETWLDGDVLYLDGTTAGKITNIKPTAPIHTIIIGYVVYAHSTNGKIFVKVDNGYELDELHNVLISSPSNGQVLKYDSSTSLWKNQSDSAGTGTVTSVDFSVPTGFAITGNPITSSGTLALSFASGYALPTTIKQSNWDDSYTFVGNFPTQTGNSGKYLTTDGSSLSWGAVSSTITTNRQTASYTLVLSDSNKLVEMNVATANNLTVPLNSSVAFPIGTQIDVIQYGAGQTSIVATGGVTIRSTNSWLKINARYGAVSLIKIATDEWYLIGNLNA